MTFSDQLASAQRALDTAEQAIREARERATALAGSIYPQMETESFRAFLNEPYILVQKRAHEYYCIVPRFIDFSVGWLERATDSYNVFLINRFTLWLGDVPESIRAATGIESPPGDLHISEGRLLFDKSSRPAAEHYKPFLSRMHGDFAQITRGKEFQLLASMIDDGYLPFVPRPVAVEDRREPNVNFNFEGKYEFQRGAYRRFLELGAVGVYWMTGAGKSFFAMAALDSIKGRKLIVVPTRTLIDQWREYFRKYAPRLSYETEIVTYNSYERVSRYEWAVTLFDECHRLPANSFSKFATLKTKYRIGLSASPKREDGRESYIFALTGFPIGMDWRSLVRILGKEYHTVTVWIEASRAAKLARIEQLLNRRAKTIIFSDSLEFGEQIAKRFSLPFINGASSNRMDVAKRATAFVASRVMDMGVSLGDLEHIIEADFLFGSRQQELQRTGRLFHSEGPNSRHDILMTKEEFEAHRKRLHGLVEKGFKVEVKQ